MRIVDKRARRLELPYPEPQVELPRELAAEALRMGGSTPAAARRSLPARPPAAPLEALEPLARALPDWSAEAEELLGSLDADSREALAWRLEGLRAMGAVLEELLRLREWIEGERRSVREA